MIVALLFLLYLILSIYNYPFEYRYSTIMVYIKIFLLILIIIYFYIRKKTHLWIKISDVILNSSVIFLFIYFIVQIFNPSYKVFVDSVGVEYKIYYNIFYVNQNINIFSYKFIRNNGVFFEPGMYAVVLLYSLIINLFFFKKNNIRLFILFLNMITTFSTTDICMMLFVIGLKYFSSLQKRGLVRHIKIIFLPIIMSFLIYGIFYVYYGKVNNLYTNSGQGSYLYRIDDIKNAFQLTLIKPFQGFGVGNFNILRLYTSIPERYYEGTACASNTSNGLMTILYQLGLINFVILFYMYFVFIKNVSKIINNSIATFSICLFLPVTLFSEPYSYTLFALMFFAYGVVYTFYNNNSTILTNNIVYENYTKN